MDRRSRTHDDRGASLILAIVFVLAIGIVIAVITQFATAATVNSANLRSQRDAEISAENLATEAIGLVRFDPVICSSAGSQFPLASKQVWCSQSGAGVRKVQFYACPNQVPCGSSGDVTLHAVVVYNDTPPNQTSSSANCSSVAQSSTCGIAVTIQTWDVVTADS